MINKAEARGTYMKGPCPEKSYKCYIWKGYKICKSHWNKSEGAEETNIDLLAGITETLSIHTIWN